MAPRCNGDYYEGRISKQPHLRRSGELLSSLVPLLWRYATNLGRRDRPDPHHSLNSPSFAISAIGHWHRLVISSVALWMGFGGTKGPSDVEGGGWPADAPGRWCSADAAGDGKHRDSRRRRIHYRIAGGGAGTAARLDISGAGLDISGRQCINRDGCALSQSGGKGTCVGDLTENS